MKRSPTRLLSALVLACALVGCSSPFFENSDLTSGGRWYVLNDRDGATSVLEGVDAIRSARGQMNAAYDWRIIGILEANPHDWIALVHDGRIVKAADAVRAGKISVGDAQSQFVPLKECRVTLQRRDVAGFMRRFRSGAILIDDVPDLPFDAAFTVELPGYAVPIGTAAKDDDDASNDAIEADETLQATVEKRVRMRLHRLLRADFFDVQVTEAMKFPISFVDKSGTVLRTKDGTSVYEDESMRLHFPELRIRASNIAFYRRIRSRKRELAHITGEPDTPTAFAPTLAKLEKAYPHAARPIAIYDSISPEHDAEIGDWTPETKDQEYWVTKPPC